MGQDTDDIRKQIEATRERVGDTVDALAFKANVPGRVRDVMQRSFTGTIETLRNPRDLQMKTRATVDNVRRNPVALIAGSAALGFLVGIVMPSRRKSNGVQNEEPRSSSTDYPPSRE